MKNYIISFALFGFCFAWSCRPKEVIAPTVVNGDNYLLKEVSVKGASEVKIDHEKGIIQVTLPESITSNSIDLNFTLAKGVFLNYTNLAGNPNTDSLENQTYRFVYAGTPPLSINVQKEYGLGSKSYFIYVNQINKKLQAEIEKIDSVYSYPDGPIKFNSVANFYLKITGANGTFPNIPNEKKNFVLLRKEGEIKADTIFLGNWQTEFSFNVEKYIPFEDKKFSLELVNNDSRLVLKENFTFIRQKPQAYYNPFGVFGNYSSFKVAGGIFLSNNQYSLRFSNDLLGNTVIVDAHFNDAHNLSVPSLLSLTTGGYIVEVLENGVVLNKEVVNIGKSVNATAIRAIKRGVNNVSGEYPSTKKEQLNLGETFSVLTENFYSSCYGIGITQEQLDKIEAPSLKLTNSLEEITLTPKKIIVWWSVATCNVVYFQYTIPGSTESGFYEAQLVYPDGRESLKYWNKIEIK